MPAVLHYQFLGTFVPNSFDMPYMCTVLCISSSVQWNELFVQLLEAVVVHVKVELLTRWWLVLLTTGGLYILEHALECK